MTPNPMQRDVIRSLEEAARVRRLDCRYQAQCLEIAVRAQWEGMSCEQCSVKEPMTLIELRADAEGMAVMWQHRLELTGSGDR